MRKKIEKNFWDMEIIGNRRKIIYFKPGQISARIRKKGKLLHNKYILLNMCIEKNSHVNI